MLEAHFESFIQKCPEFIEPELVLCSRQLSFKSCRFDLVFTDRNRKTLLVEIKARELAQQDIGQVVRYRAELSHSLGLVARVMLVGTGLSEDIRHAMEDVSIEWKVVREDEIRSKLLEIGDQDLLDLLSLGGSEPVVEVQTFRIMPSQDIGRREGNPSAGSAPGKLPSPRRQFQSSMTLDEKYHRVFSSVPVGTRLTRKEIEDSIMRAFPGEQTAGGILPTDRCYNIVNVGVPDPKFRMFNHRGGGMFEYLGEHYPFNGFVTWKDIRCGEWKNGVLFKYTNWPKKYDR